MGASDMTTEPMPERPTVPDADSPEEVEHDTPHDDPEPAREPAADESSGG